MLVMSDASLGLAIFCDGLLRPHQDKLMVWVASLNVGCRVVRHSMYGLRRKTSRATMARCMAGRPVSTRLIESANPTQHTRAVKCPLQETP